MYSTRHCNKSLGYDGSNYIKVARSSALLNLWKEHHPNFDHFQWLHLAFVGLDFCYETIGNRAPVIRQFPTMAEAEAWRPGIV